MGLTESDDEVVLLHNPRCSKSRAVLKILEESGVAFRVRRYLERPLARTELDDLRQRLGLRPGEWFRIGEAEARNAGLSADSEDESLLDAMAAHPILVERPIVVRGEHARVGRPPDAVRELL